MWTLPLVARGTHHGAVAGGRHALPVLTPLTEPGVGRAAGAVGEPEALLVCALWKREEHGIHLLWGGDEVQDEDDR